MKPCVFHKHHDYFQGSELAYILGVVLIVLFPLIVLFCAYIAIKVLHYNGLVSFTISQS